MTVTPEHDLLSIGKLCEVLQSSPGAVERAAAKARVVPALRLNGVIYFSDSQVSAIRERLRIKKEKFSDH
jgi:hypothetical protein